jgi:hypothetical protein
MLLAKNVLSWLSQLQPGIGTKTQAFRGFWPGKRNFCAESSRFLPEKRRPPTASTAAEGGTDDLGRGSGRSGRAVSGPVDPTGCAAAPRPAEAVAMPTVYCASKSRHAPWWQALRACGLDLRASWVDAEFNHTGAEPDNDEWRHHWVTCIREASEADIMLVYARADERQMGALCELGAGLAAGAWVYLVSDSAWSIGHHPRVRVFPDLQSAVAATVAADSGERARAA